MLKDFFRKYGISDDEFLVVACSWWSDSMFLLSETIKSHPKDKIVIAHFNHNLRWEESDMDELFVKKEANRLWTIFVSWNWDINTHSRENKLWIEESARLKRYEFLREIKHNYNARYILTAHHLDDSIETFIFNLLRWTKLNWLSWISEENSDILRPLLDLTKDEILEKTQKENICYVEDSSNKDDKYLRNHIRLNLVPQFQKINPNFKRNISDLMEYFSSLSGFIEAEISNHIEESYFEIDKFKALDPFLQKEIIAHIFKKTNDWTIWLNKWNIDEVLRFIDDKWNNTIKEIKNMRLNKKSGKILFSRIKAK